MYTLSEEHQTGHGMRLLHSIQLFLGTSMSVGGYPNMPYMIAFIGPLFSTSVDIVYQGIITDTPP